MKIIKSTIKKSKQYVYCIEVKDKNHNFVLENNIVVSNCGSSCHDSSLSAGSSTVYVNGKQLARIGDPVGCGSVVAQGSGNVFAG